MSSPSLSCRSIIARNCLQVSGPHAHSGRGLRGGRCLAGQEFPVDIGLSTPYDSRPTLLAPPRHSLAKFLGACIGKQSVLEVHTSIFRIWHLHSVYNDGPVPRRGVPEPGCSTVPAGLGSPERTTPGGLQALPNADIPQRQTLAGCIPGTEPLQTQTAARGPHQGRDRAGAVQWRLSTADTAINVRRPCSWSRGLPTTRHLIRMAWGTDFGPFGDFLLFAILHHCLGTSLGQGLVWAKCKFQFEEKT